MEEQKAGPHPVEVWYRVHYSKHYYPPIKTLQMARGDLKDAHLVRKNMTRIIRQVAYAGIIFSLCIAAGIFIIALAGYSKSVNIKNIACLIGFIGLAYGCKVIDKKQVAVRADFWDSKIGEEDLFKKTGAGRLMVILLFLAFAALCVLAFYDVKVK